MTKVIKGKEESSVMEKSKLFHDQIEDLIKTKNQAKKECLDTLKELVNDDTLAKIQFAFNLYSDKDRDEIELHLNANIRVLEHQLFSMKADLFKYLVEASSHREIDSLKILGVFEKN